MIHTLSVLAQCAFWIGVMLVIAVVIPIIRMALFPRPGGGLIFDKSGGFRYRCPIVEFWLGRLGIHLVIHIRAGSKRFNTFLRLGLREGGYQSWGKS